VFMRVCKQVVAVPLRNGWFLAVAACVILATVAAPVVRANSITVSSFSVAPSGSVFTWTYNLSVSSGSTVQPNDYFGFQNCLGYVPGSATGPTGWTFSNPATMPCPPGQAQGCAGNNPSIGDLLWTYTGSPINGGTTGASLGSFTVQSITVRLATVSCWRRTTVT
jgi:hypothetical protein